MPSLPSCASAAQSLGCAADKMVFLGSETLKPDPPPILSLIPLAVQADGWLSPVLAARNEKAPWSAAGSWESR